MPTPALVIEATGGELFPVGDAGAVAVLRLESGRVWVHEPLVHLLGERAGLRITLEPTGVALAGRAGAVPWHGRVTLAVLPDGRLRFQVSQLRALGFLPVPESFVAGALDRIAARPGITCTGGSTLEWDPAPLLATFGVRLAGRIQSLTTGHGRYALEIAPPHPDAPADE